MSEKRIIPIVVLLITAVLLIVAVTQLLGLQFSSGAAYPPYSSLRSEPLGTKVLYVSLDKLPDYTVSRNYKPLNELADVVATSARGR